MRAGEEKGEQKNRECRELIIMNDVLVRIVVAASRFANAKWQQTLSLLSAEPNQIRHGNGSFPIISVDVLVKCYYGRQPTESQSPTHAIAFIQFRIVLNARTRRKKHNIKTVRNSFVSHSFRWLSPFQFIPKITMPC